MPSLSPEQLDRVIKFIDKIECPHSCVPECPWDEQKSVLKLKAIQELSKWFTE